MQVSSGREFSLAIKSDYTLWSWGYNTQGQLGDLTVANKSSPVKVTGSITSWSFIRTLATTSMGIPYGQSTLYVWGDDGGAYLGRNQTGINVSSPVQLGSAYKTSITSPIQLSIDPYISYNYIIGLNILFIVLNFKINVPQGL